MFGVHQKVWGKVSRAYGIKKLNFSIDNRKIKIKNLTVIAPHFLMHFNVPHDHLRNLLKVLTRQTTQQHIHNKPIDKAKEALPTTDLSESEIACQLGFDHSQSFSKLF